MVGFAKDVRPLFTDTDIAHMGARGLDLNDHDDVMNNADLIYEKVTSGAMPPQSTGGVRWTKAQCDLFKSWQTGGCQP